jgi:hypothetical protein
VLHLLNGDATAAVFPDTLPGERAVWRDILMEGPADADADTRAAWLAPRLGVSPDAYAQRWRESVAMLARAKEHDEVVLWFERDLFCAINLWFVLTRLDASRVSLVFAAVDTDFRGLGTLDANHFPPLFERREQLGLDEIADARALWRAYTAQDPTGLAGHDAILPFARSAIRLHCGRFPSTTDGLDELEHQTLATLDGAIEFGALFRRVTTVGPLNELGLGDVQFAAMLRDLAAGPTPLVAIADHEQSFQRWRISRTPAAVDVLAGRVDRPALAPLDRWLGGVHLLPGAPLWRWDGRRLAPAAA